MTDLIDRQALLQALCNEDGAQHEYCYPCKTVLDVVNSVSSVQTSSDLIDRRAAIDAADNMVEPQESDVQ